MVAYCSYQPHRGRTALEFNRAGCAPASRSVHDFPVRQLRRSAADISFVFTASELEHLRTQTPAPTLLYKRLSTSLTCKFPYKMSVRMCMCVPMCLQVRRLALRSRSVFSNLMFKSPNFRQAANHHLLKQVVGLSSRGSAKKVFSFSELRAKAAGQPQQV